MREAIMKVVLLILVNFAWATLIPLAAMTVA